MSRAAAETTCRQCWTYTLTGVDADRAALVAVVDNSPLTRTGELLAVLAGRTTYEIDASGALHRRDRWTIRSAAAGQTHAEHRCGQPLPVAWLKPRPRTTPAPATEGMPY